MAASVASTFGPGFVVGVRRPIALGGRAKLEQPRAVRAESGPMRPKAPRPPLAEFAPVVRPQRSAPPMRRRFEAATPEAAPPVTRRARRIERPASERGHVRPRVRRGRSRAAARCDRAVSSRIRLTRRGRVLLLVLAAVAVYAAFGLGRASAGAHTPPHASAVVVQRGDSLWSIAVREFPNSDPRDVVGELKSLNQLSSAGLVAGQRLRLP